MSKNIMIEVTNPGNPETSEEQIYTNRSDVSISRIRKIFITKSLVNPEIGNFPHVSGDNNPVRISRIRITDREDNAGMDVSEVIGNFKKWVNENG